MSEILKTIFTKAGFSNNYILIIGGAIFSGIVAAGFVKKFRIPQIVGYVAVGVILGPVLGFIPQESVHSLELFNMVALGLIGFLVGGELKRDIFIKFGRQVPIVLIFEGCTAFLLVGVLTFFAMWQFSDWQTAVAVSIVFAAICSATDPAST